MDSGKTLIIFFFQKPRKSKNAVYYQKNQRFLCEIDQKVPIFVEKLKKTQPPKMTFRSQVGPLIKRYQYFMFLQHFRFEITLDCWILEKPCSFFSFKNRERVKMQSIIKKTKLENCLVILVGVLFRVILNSPVLHSDLIWPSKAQFLFKKAKKKLNIKKWPSKVK